jgi:DNA helicase-2/ATP-dependent DNA helicase PcrA
MENYLQVLNEQQYRAVTTESQYVRVVAGAGSGKTRVLTSRIVYVIGHWGIDPHSVLAITFTNKAANEMRSRINQQLPEQAGMIQISTIHAFCVVVLRRDIRHLGYPANFTILDQDDQKSIIKEAYKTLELDPKRYNLSVILDFIAGCKYAGISGKMAEDKAFNPYEKGKARIYQYYEQRQAQLYALDFDDLILWTVKLLRQEPEVRAKWQRRFRFILCDEFQDFEDTQYELVKLLACEDTYVFVVGDPDQTIYTWRGADINIILHFDQDFKPCETITLERNYRSTKNILGAANSLIKYNRDRLEKNLYTENGDGTKIIHFKAPDEEDEALYVAKEILRLTGKDGYGYDDCAILYRSNYQSRSFEKSLIDYKIPYVIYGGIRFYERAEIKDALSYLRMLTAQDDLSFKRIINVPRRGIGTKTVDNILQAARRDGVTMYEEAAKMDFPPRLKKEITGLIKQIEDWKIRAGEQPIEQTLQMVLQESGYRRMLDESEDPKDAERQENLKELINDMVDFQATDPDAKLADYLQMVALYTDIATEQQGKFVSLMTVHSAKGLEFDNVFVVGLSDGIFPSMKSMEEGMRGLEEERRLAYVAFTRAREHLYLTESMGYSYTTSSGKIPSRFFDEVDEQYIETQGIRPKGEPAPALSGEEEEAAAARLSQRKRVRYRPGDIVVHDDFGEGVVLTVNGNFGDIAFGYPYKTKTMSLNFPKLHKKEDKGDE